MGLRRSLSELLPENAGQRRHDLREVFNALRELVRGGIIWRMLPHDFPLLAANPITGVGTCYHLPEFRGR